MVRAEGDARALLGVYLNDHLAGATAGLGLVRRTARFHGGAAGETLRGLAEEIAADREALLDMMITLRVPIRRYKIGVGWAMERLGRLKLNGRLLSRSPLSGVVELESLRMGVQGKAETWHTLRLLANVEPRLDPVRLDGLVERARRQAKTLEELCEEETVAVFVREAG
ncbi:hypothetical protein DPM19_00610 [Actinomadura craniellae]|uniref:Uncharacterized protein n=1 Tax=Actinomadura craniellae TaxID=2231787 RepID=A0A365HC96_9ACTN|nr:hypothetical protein DPM19_00610 [Actinomadura craniellae]